MSDLGRLIQKLKLSLFNSDLDGEVGESIGRLAVYRSLG
jgi:hypothetical protein